MNTRDPVLNHLVQPLVDRSGADPAPWALRIAEGFALTAIFLSFSRILTYGNVMLFSQFMHIIGALILCWWMRWTARHGAITRMGPLGVLHVAMRWMLLACALMDLPTLIDVIRVPNNYMPGAPLRIILQVGTNLLGATSLFLSACTKPPPRRRTAKIFA